MNKKSKFGLIIATISILATGAIAAPLITSCSESTNPNGPNSSEEKPDKNLPLSLKSVIDLSSKVVFKSGTNEASLAQKPISFKLGDKQSFVINLEQTDNFFSLDLSNVKATDLFDNANDSLQLVWSIATLTNKPDVLVINCKDNIITNQNSVNQTAQTVVLLKLTVIDNVTNKNKNISFNLIINKQIEGQDILPLPPDLEIPSDDNNSSNGSNGDSTGGSTDGSQDNNGNNTTNGIKPSFNLITDSISNSEVKDNLYKTLNYKNIANLSNDLATAFKDLDTYYVRENLNVFFGTDSVNIKTIYDAQPLLPLDVDSKKPNLLLRVQYESNDGYVYTRLFSIIGFNDASLDSNYDIYLMNLAQNLALINKNTNNVNYLVSKFNKEKASISSDDILNVNNHQIKNLLDASIWSLNNSVSLNRFLTKSDQTKGDRTLVLTDKDKQLLNGSLFELSVENFKANLKDLTDPLNLHKEIKSNNINTVAIKFKDSAKKEKVNIPNFFVFDNSTKMINKNNFATEFSRAIDYVYILIKSKISTPILSGNYSITNNINLYYNADNQLTKQAINNQILNTDFVINSKANNNYKYKIGDYLLKYSVLYLFANNYSFSIDIQANLVNFDVSSNYKLSIGYDNNNVDTSIVLSKNEEIADTLEVLIDKIAQVINQELKDVTVQLPKGFFQNNNSSIGFYVWDAIKDNVSINTNNYQNINEWLNSIIKANINSEYLFVNKMLKIIKSFQIDLCFDKFYNPIISFKVIYKEQESGYYEPVNAITRKLNINLKAEGFTDSNSSDIISARPVEINIDNFVEKDDFLGINSEMSVFHFISHYKDESYLTDFIYKCKLILFENGQKLDAGMIEDANLSLIDNVDPKNPKVSLKVKIKNQKQTLNITIYGFNDASLKTYLRYYLENLGEFISQVSLYYAENTTLNKYIKNNNINTDILGKIKTEILFNKQLFLSTDKPIKDMTENDYLNIVQNKLKSFDSNLTLDKLINAFNNSPIYGSVYVGDIPQPYKYGNESIPSRPWISYSIILTPEEKQMLNSNVLKFDVVDTKELSKDMYDNYLPNDIVLNNLKLKKSANLLSIAFKDDSYSYTTNLLVQETSKQLSINEFVVYFAAIFNTIISANKDTIKDSVNIDVPKSLSLQEEIVWIDSQIANSFWSYYAEDYLTFSDIILAANFILHQYNYSLPANFDYSDLIFTINNNNQLVVKYKDSIEQPIDLKVNLKEWNIINKNEYVKEFETYLNQLLGNNKIQLSKSKLASLKSEKKFNGINIKEHWYIMNQIFNALSKETRLKIASINEPVYYKNLIKNGNRFYNIYNPFFVAFNYEQASKGTNLILFNDNLNVQNESFKVNTTLRLWNFDSVSNYNHHFAFSFDEKTQKIKLSTELNYIFKNEPIEINLPIELVD